MGLRDISGEAKRKSQVRAPLSNDAVAPLTSITRKSLRTATGRHARELTSVVVGEIDRQRRDAGLSISALARGSNVSQAHISQVLAGEREPSIAVLTALTEALGADLSIRVYPGTGPKLRDGIQARIVEQLVRLAAPAWRRSIEVPVSRPARGYIDVVFDDPAQCVIVATEVQSRMDRLEQQVRWAQDKAQSLPSAELWRFLPATPTISRLLILRSTVATRDLARRFRATLERAYPALAADVYRALISGVKPWPGAGILWADVHGEVVRILDRPPRGVDVGR
jgi:transcriptional regulator with XRE-family HTH domain